MVGQKVVCIDAKNLPKMMPMSVASKLIENEVYTVERVLFHDMQQSYGFVLEEIDMTKAKPMFESFQSKRFIIATEQDILANSKAEEAVDYLLKEVLELEEV